MDKKTDLAIAADSTLDSNSPAFGAKVEGDKLHLPPALAKHLEIMGLTQASHIFTYLRATGGGMDDVEGISPDQAQRFRELNAMIEQHVDPQTLAPRPPLKVGYGVLIEEERREQKQQGRGGKF